MEKTELTKADKGIINSLKSADKKIVAEAVQNFRNNGRAKLIPYVLDLLLETKDREIREKIILLLNDMKDQSAVPMMVEAIEDQKYEKILPELLSACWQSGLNYADYYELFTNLVIHSFYACSIEAFSIIEQCIDKFTIDDEERIRQKELIGEKISEVNEDKAALLNELIKVYSE